MPPKVKWKGSNQELYMTSKVVQKRQSTNPVRPKKGLAKNSKEPSISRPAFPEKVVGVSWKASLFLFLASMFLFNFYMIKQVNSMRVQIHALSNESNKEVKVVVDQKYNPNALEINYFNQKIENFKGEILDKISEIQTNTKIETIVTRSSASAPIYRKSAIDQMGSIDVKKYTVQNPRSFPKYHRYLSEKSAGSRELRSLLTDIIKDYSSSHKVFGKDRAEYNQILAFRDSVRNNYLDANEAADRNWFRIYRPRVVLKY
jgi:hypothetical protein